jgi:hypothetical protein
MTRRICPICRATNKPDDLYCGSCSADLLKERWITRHKTTLATISGFVLLSGVLLGLLLPNPYNIRYAINRLSRQATFECSDGTFSWSPVPGGACSSHGSIIRRFDSNGAEIHPSFKCTDGSPSFAATRQGACSGHGGIDEDYTDEPQPGRSSIPSIPGLPRIH